MRERVPHRVRQHGRDPGRRLALLGSADRTVAPPLLDRRPGLRTHAARGGARDGRAEEGGGHGEPGRRPPRRRARAPHHRRGGRGDRRDARRALPAVRVADRLRHADEHERQRGRLQPRDRDGRRRDGLEDARASERPREHVAVLERHVPDRDAHRGGRDDRSAAPAERPAVARRVGGAREGVRRHREDRAHAPAGRRPAHARSGVRRVRRPARRRHRADRAHAPRTAASWRSAAPPWAPG